MVGGWSRVIQDRYRVDRELGRRGPVSTWLVTNLKSVTPCVLKCLREAEAQPAEARLFEAQARILAGLEHPGLPRLVEYFTEGEGIAREQILILRYHPGESLARLVAKGRLLTETQAVALLRRLVPVLSYLHGLDPPLIHRGLKPENIIVGPDGRPCLTDLHFAVEGEGGKAWEELSPAAAETLFVAPEVALGEATPASDIYALGLALVYGMSGRDPAAIALEGGRQRIRDATRAGDAFAAILARMVEAAPDRRYPDSRALEADLARLAAGRGPAAAPLPQLSPQPKAPAPAPQPATSPPPARAAERPKRGSALRVAALLTVLAAAAMLWLSAARREQPRGESLLTPPPVRREAPAPDAVPAAPAPAPSVPPVGDAPPAAPSAPTPPSSPEKPAGETGVPVTLPPPAASTPEQAAPSPAPAPAEASPVVAEGRLLYDGKPVTEITSLQPTFWFRNESKDTPEKPQVDYRDGTFRIRGLPAGRMGMSMRINLEQGNPNLYPGDLDAWTTFVVGAGPPPSLEVHLRKVIRLTQPADNGKVIGGWEVPCGGGSVHPGRVLFSWEPVGPAATYDVSIDRLACGRNYAVAGRAFKTTTSEAWVKAELAPSAEGECYSFRVTARREGRPLGILTTHGRDGLRWDYRFTVK